MTASEEAAPETPPFPARQYDKDVHLVEYGEKRILLVGTAHISQQSVDLVTTVLTSEEPDCVCLELDDKRYQAMTRPEAWEELDLRTIIREKRLAALIVNLIMAAYQKRLGLTTGVKPGSELLAAATLAREKGLQISLCDRDVRITLRRAWKKTSLWRKGWLFATLITSLFDKEKLDEEELTRMRQKDALEEIMDEMGDSLPELKHVLIDERDTYLVEKIKASPGNRLVAVVGAGHVAGMIKKFDEENRDRLEEITTIPPVSTGMKIFGWSIPVLILGSICFIGWRQGIGAAGDNLLFWALVNGVPAAIGTAIALGHPLTILAALLSAPVTSLTPVIGAGYVCAFVQIWTKPPRVYELRSAGDDIATARGWWKNRLLRTFLVFVFSTFGSLIGTWAGGIEIMKRVFE